MSTQEKELSKAYRLPLTHIIKDMKEWPLYQLSQDKDIFLENVVFTTKESLLKTHRSSTALYNLLASVLFQERIRITQNSWKSDPPDEKDFWNTTRGELLKFKKENNTEFIDGHLESELNPRLLEILDKILMRYAYEIVGNFNPKVFQFAQKFLPWIFSILLNSISSIRIFSFWKKKPPFYKKFKITGDLELMRSLAKEGTIVIVPTHFSNLDSPVIGYAVESCGLPAVIYGAGLNLFNVQPLSFLMGNLGAYKLDRRKRNSIYLELIKNYSQVAIERGTHSLFYPNGTRSRSGAIEPKLKLGLLGTAVAAQFENVKHLRKKIFIVPAVINYNFVLEAPALINQHLKEIGKEKFVVDNFEYSSTYKILKLIKQIFTSDTDLTVSFSHPLDVVGNKVDEKGNSINHLGKKVLIDDYFKIDHQLLYNEQRNFEYTKILGDKILDCYYQYNTILSSHIIPFVAFEILKRKYHHLDLYGLLRLPMEDTQINYSEFCISLEKIRTKIQEMYKQGNVQISEEINFSIEKLISHGIKNIGIFHAKKVLFIDTNGNINGEDLKLLYFYHNRLLGYKLEQ